MSLRDQVAARIKTLRKERGLTQERLAEAIDRSVYSVSQLERGVTVPSFETLERLAERFSVPISWFFEGRGEGERIDRRALLKELVETAGTLPGDDLRTVLDLASLLAARRQPAKRP